VKKTSIYLEPELDRALARIARERGLTKADFIRGALAAAVDGVDKRPRFTAIGVIKDGPTDVSTNTDKYLEGLGED
jgi:predicted DNA-binding protein